jgi:hypothetical protein
MSGLCSACTVLQLPRIRDFGGRTKILRSVNFNVDCAIGNNKFLQPILQNPKADPRETHPNSETSFCGECSFCVLILDTISTRQQVEIMQALQEMEEHIDHMFKSQRPWVKIKLFLLTFRRRSDKADYLGRQTRIEEIFLVELKGELDIGLQVQGRESHKSLPSLVPLEPFADNNDTVAVSGTGIYRRPVDSQPLSSGNMSLIKDWLSECIGTHKNCAVLEQISDVHSFVTENGRSMFLPTRLIHVGSNIDGHEPRIVSTVEEFSSGVVDEARGRYLTLSYCWGSDDEGLRPLTSTLNTIDDWRKGIRWEKLPQVFQDLILLARELGILYLWVDSLCILQGNGGDWLEESAKMAYIYGNAFLTVISASGSSCHEGFLNRPSSSSCHVSSPMSSIPYCLRPRFGAKWWGSDRMAEIAGKRWISRGWTYQEEHLSRRVIQYGERRFFFDCRTFERQEDTNIRRPRPRWSTLTYLQDSTEMNLIGSKLESKSRRKSEEIIFRDWHWLCTQYSHRKVTYMKDRLPAISGVAGVVASKVQSTYLAGLWKKSLIHDLFWHTVGDTTKCSPYTAPSWSWIALYANFVTWRDSNLCSSEKCQLYCEVLEAVTSPIGPDPFGAVESGHLKVKGHLIEVRVVWARNESRDYPWSIVHMDEYVAMGNLDMQKGPVDHKTPVFSAWALLMATCVESEDSKGLLLQKLGSSDGIDKFERVGIFKVTLPASSVAGQTPRPWNEVDKSMCIIE